MVISKQMNRELVSVEIASFKFLRVIKKGIVCSNQRELVHVLMTFF